MFWCSVHNRKVLWFDFLFGIFTVGSPNLIRYAYVLGAEGGFMPAAKECIRSVRTLELSFRYVEDKAPHVLLYANVKNLNDIGIGGGNWISICRGGGDQLILEIWAGTNQWQIVPVRIENSASSITEISENLEKDKTMMIPFDNPWAFGRIDER